MKCVHCFKWIILLVLSLGICHQAQAQQQVEIQKPSRAEAIARIAELYPNSSKSAEQIYDEGQAWEVVQAFCKGVTFRNFDALMGPIYEDSAEVAASRRLNPAIEVKKYIGPSIPTGAHPDTWVAPDEPAYHDTTYARARASDAMKQQLQQVVVQEDVRGSNEAVSHLKVLSSATKEYTVAERRDMKRSYFGAVGDLPTDVRIGLYPQKVTVMGQHATVEAELGYEVLGKPTIRSAPFVGQPKKPIRLQMQRDGDDWQVVNLRGVLQQVVREVGN